MMSNNQRLLKTYIKLLFEAEEEKKNSFGIDLSKFNPEETDSEKEEDKGEDPVNKTTPMAKNVIKALDSDAILQKSLGGLKNRSDIEPVIAKILDKTGVSSADSSIALDRVKKHEKEDEGEATKTSKATKETEGTKSTKGTSLSKE